MVTVGYSRLQQVTERVQWFTAGYSGYRVVTVGCSRLQQVNAAGYRVITVGYSRFQQVTEWLQWVTAGYTRLPSGYRGLQQDNE